MKVKVTVEADARDRYVVAKYFGDTRSRATRQQVRAFVAGAFRTCVREHGDALRGRQRATARRLADGTPVPDRVLREPDERQLSLFVGAGEGGR